MGADGLSLDVDRLPETVGGHVSAHERIKFGKDIGQPGPLHDLRGDRGQQRLRHRDSPGSQVSLVHFGLGGDELHLQRDAEHFLQFVLIIDRCEAGKVDAGELLDIVCQTRFGDRNSDVIGQPVLHWLDDHLAWRIVRGRGDTNAFCFKLVTQDVEQIPRAEHLQRLCAIRADRCHQAQPTPDDLLGEDLRFGGERPQPEHHRNVVHVPALTQHHDTDDCLDPLPWLVDIACDLTGLLQVSLGDLTRSVCVDNEDFRFFETKFRGLPEVSPNGIGEHVLFRHDEQHRSGAKLSVCLVMLLPALHSGMDPVAVLLTDVLSGDVVRVVRWLLWGRPPW